MNSNNFTRTPLEEDVFLDRELASYVKEISTFDTKGRRIGEGGSVSSITAILHEISQTLLPRKLVFHAECGDILTLDVTDRHVSAFTVGSNDEISRLPNWGPTRLDVASIYAVVSEFASVAVPIFVQSQRGFAVILGAPRVPVHKLQQYHPPAVGTAVSLIKRFMLRLGPIPKAVLMTDGSGAEETIGDVTALTQLSTTLLAEGLSDGKSGDQMIILTEGPLNSERGDLNALLFAQIDEIQILCSFDANDALAVASHWMSERGRIP